MAWEPIRARTFRHARCTGKCAASLGDAIKKGRIKRPFHRFELDLASEILRDEIPVDQIPECRDIVGTPIAIIDVVGVLPHVAG